MRYRKLCGHHIAVIEGALNDASGSRIQRPHRMDVVT